MFGGCSGANSNNFARNISVLVFVGFVAAGNGIRIREPAVEIDIPAALGTEWAGRLDGGLAADRARLFRSLRRAGAVASIFGRVRRHSTNQSEPENLRRQAV